MVKFEKYAINIQYLVILHPKPFIKLAGWVETSRPEFREWNHKTFYVVFKKEADRTFSNSPFAFFYCWCLICFVLFNNDYLFIADIVIVVVVIVVVVVVDIWWWRRQWWEYSYSDWGRKSVFIRQATRRHPKSRVCINRRRKRFHNYLLLISPLLKMGRNKPARYH